jgi:hypothetical protein
VVDKNPTDITKVRFTELNKKFNKYKNSKILQNQLNLTFLHLKLTISVLTIIKLHHNKKKFISTSEILLLIFIMSRARQFSLHNSLLWFTGNIAFEA